MKINAILLRRKSAILQRWFDLILDTYPKDTSDFFKGRERRVADTLGQIIFDGIEGVFDQLVNRRDPEKIKTCLDNIVRVRAIQEFDPSQAIGFIFLLKKVIREELISEVREGQLFEELMQMESHIDELLGASFDIYMKCREKIYELRANELRNWTYRIVKRSNMVREVPAEE